MRHTAWRWLFSWRWLAGLGALAAAGALVLGQVQAAAASPAAPAPGMRAARAGMAARSSAPAYVPPSQLLVLGMHGPAVRALQKRLAALKYYPGPADGQFGLDTLEAVWAFKEVQGYPVNSANEDVVSRATERALVHPRSPKVLVPHGGSMRIEVNMRNETLVLYNRNRVELISHVSTGAGCLPGQGCGWDTPTGNFRTIWFYRGWIQVPLGEMYNPVFFIGSTFAIHGELNTSVPWYPDSHGCVRIPYDIANFFHTLVKIPGTPVYIRG
ncbi:MAG TPA: L,D-transpeptidase family protein [Streptosporangiaceae bacterium]|nr:L,D-transpeptidase family protein [Streptosporangiaceae bacterium]